MENPFQYFRKASSWILDPPPQQKRGGCRWARSAMNMRGHWQWICGHVDICVRFCFNNKKRGWCWANRMSAPNEIRLGLRGKDPLYIEREVLRRCILEADAHASGPATWQLCQCHSDSPAWASVHCLPCQTLSFIQSRRPGKPWEAVGFGWFWVTKRSPSFAYCN